MSDLFEAAAHKRRELLDDTFTHGGAIMFYQTAIEQGLVLDVLAGKWYPLVRTPDEDFAFIDEAQEYNYAGAKGSRLYRKAPLACLTSPF